MRTGTGTDDTITVSTGNVFEDLGLPDAEDRLAEAKLARQMGTFSRECERAQQAEAHGSGSGRPEGQPSE